MTCSKLCDFGNNDVIPARAGGLGTDDFCDLELSLRVGGPDDSLKLPRLWRVPRVSPNHPGIGRHGCFDLTAVPGAPGIKAQFHFADAVGAAERDAAKGVLLSLQSLVMSG